MEMKATSFGKQVKILCNEIFFFHFSKLKLMLHVVKYFCVFELNEIRGNEN